jgi:hypothetical protein
MSVYTNIGSGAAKLELSVSYTGTLEERQFAEVIILQAPYRLGPESGTPASHLFEANFVRGTHLTIS